MFNTAFRRQVATILCTLVMSTACIVSAVGPVQADAAARAATQTVA